MGIKEMTEMNGKLNILRIKNIFQKPMHSTSVFFYQIIKYFNMKGRLLYFLPLFIFVFSCEEKKIQQEHKIDLFADERQEGKAYVMSEQECFDASDLVISTSDIKLADSSTGRGKAVFIYKIKSGEVLKTTRDSIVNFQMQILANQRLKLKSPMYVYLKRLEGYRFIAKDKHLKYQWLKAAPVYSVEREN